MRLADALNMETGERFRLEIRLERQAVKDPCDRLVAEYRAFDQQIQRLIDALEALGRGGP